MDYNAGLVLDELESLKLEEKTLVVFLGMYSNRTCRECSIRRRYTPNV